jgi:hypothetical protein
VDGLSSFDQGAPELLRVSSVAERATVYNLEVANFHSYFVGDAAVWVHNANGGCQGQLGPRGPPVPAKGNIVVIGSQEDTAVAKDWPGHDVLDLPNGQWTIEKNDAWVAQAIARGATVYLASPQNQSTLWDSAENRERVYARELRQFLDAGYTQNGDYLLPPGTVLPP